MNPLCAVFFFIISDASKTLQKLNALYTEEHRGFFIFLYNLARFFKINYITEGSAVLIYLLNDCEAGFASQFFPQLSDVSRLYLSAVLIQKCFEPGQRTGFRRSTLTKVFAMHARYIEFSLTQQVLMFSKLQRF